MNSMLRKLIQYSLIVGFVANVATAYDLSKKTTVMIFKGFGNSKYPYALKCNQFSNQVDLILYGCLDSDGDVKLITSVEDYVNLVPVKLNMGMPDNWIKIEKTYSGYHETYLTRAADSTLRVLGLLPEEDYKKDFKDDFLMNEYTKGQPIKLVLSTLEHFNVLIKKYLLPRLESGKIVPPAQKPLLFIEIESGEAINQTDLDGLNKYFEVADPQDEKVVAFFKESEEKIDGVLEYYKEYYHVGQSFGELLMQSLERDFEKGEVKKLVVRYAKYIALGLTILFIEEVLRDAVVNPAKKKIEAFFKPSTAP